MQGITILLAAVGSFLCLFLKPARAAGIYLAVLMWWPTYLVVQIGTLDVSAGRIVVFFLLLRFFLNPSLLHKFQFLFLDAVMAILALVSMTAPILAGVDAFSYLETAGGAFMDTYFAYAAARLCIRRREDFLELVKMIAVFLFPLSLLALFETATGFQIFQPLMQYRPWQLPGRGVIEPRFGLTRALGPSGHSILFGATFALFIPWLYTLRFERDFWRKGAYLFCLFASLGTMASLSSGPWIMMILIWAALWFESRKDLLKIVLWMTGIALLLIILFSNRPFYHVLSDYANPLGGSSWHRARLIDCAIDSFHEWCFFGYGLRDPGWGPALGMGWTDITNHFIFVAVHAGLPGLLLFIGILAGLIFHLAKKYRQADSPEIRSMYWGFCSILAVLLIVFHSCTFFAQIQTFFYFLLGVQVSATSPSFVLTLCKGAKNGLSRTPAGIYSQKGRWRSRKQ